MWVVVVTLCGTVLGFCIALFIGWRCEVSANTPLSAPIVYGAADIQAAVAELNRVRDRLAVTQQQLAMFFGPADWHTSLTTYTVGGATVTLSDDNGRVTTSIDDSGSRILSASPDDPVPVAEEPKASERNYRGIRIRDSVPAQDQV
jgi:hypothetical protein